MLLAPGRVDDEDAAAAGGGHVDVVDAGAGAADDAQLRRGGEQIGGHLGRAAHQQRVGVGEIADQFGGGRPLRASIVPARFGAEQIERRGGQVVGDNDFQCVRVGVRPMLAQVFDDGSITPVYSDVPA